MENTVNRIIAIDKDAEKFKKIKEEELKQKKNNLSMQIKEMRDSMENKIKETKALIEQEFIKKIDDEITRINRSKEKEEGRVIGKYNNEKDKIVYDILNEIIDDPKEE